MGAAWAAASLFNSNKAPFTPQLPSPTDYWVKGFFSKCFTAAFSHCAVGSCVIEPHCTLSASRYNSVFFETFTVHLHFSAVPALCDHRGEWRVTQGHSAESHGVKSYVGCFNVQLTAPAATAIFVLSQRSKVRGCWMCRVVVAWSSEGSEKLMRVSQHKRTR